MTSGLGPREHFVSRADLVLRRTWKEYRGNFPSQPSGFTERFATTNMISSFRRSCHSSGAAVWESRWPSWLSVLTSHLVSVDVKLYWTMLRHWSQLVPNMSTDTTYHLLLILLNFNSSHSFSMYFPLCHQCELTQVSKAGWKKKKKKKT